MYLSTNRLPATSKKLDLGRKTRVEMDKLKKHILPKNRIKSKRPSVEVPVITIEDSMPKDDEIRHEKLPTLDPGTPKTSDSISVSSTQKNEYPEMLPPTQDGSVEVAWDWHSSARKSKSGKSKKSTSCEQSSTPKRRRMHRKRVSNSPLIYKPVKRQIINKENTDAIDKFKAEMMAVAEHIKPIVPEENTPKNETNNNAETYEIPDELDFDEFSDEESNLVITVREEDVIITNKAESEHRKSIEDLFDTSLNDEVMIRCSQEIEERLNIIPIDQKKPAVPQNTGKNVLRTNNCSSTSTSVKNPAPSSSISRETSEISSTSAPVKQNNNDPPKKYPSSLISTVKAKDPPKNMVQIKPPFTKYKSEPIKPKETSLVGKSNVSGLQSAKKNRESSCERKSDPFDPFGIDDAFDFSFNEADLLRVESGACGSFYSRNQLVETPRKQVFAPKVPSKSSVPNSGPKPAPQSKLPSTITGSSVPATHNWKFFKSKSRSETNCATSPGKNVPASTKKMGSSVSSENPAKQWANSGPESGILQPQSANDNPNVSHVNRSERNVGGSVQRGLSQSGDVASGLQSLQLCTPQEIERKRLEAKMKLEAKKKRLQMTARANTKNTISTSVARLKR